MAKKTTTKKAAPKAEPKAETCPCIADALTAALDALPKGHVKTQALDAADANAAALQAYAEARDWDKEIGCPTAASPEVIRTPRGTDVVRVRLTFPLPKNQSVEVYAQTEVDA
jgi:hypothetical protein